MFLLGGTLGERGDKLKNPSWFKSGVQQAKSIRKPMRTATNWNQKKVKLTRAREGYGLRGFIVKKYIYLPDFLDETGKPFDIYQSAYCASYYTVLLAGPAYYFFNSRAGSPREVDWDNPKYPGLLRVDRSLSGERGETFRVIREIEGTKATGESYSFARQMAVAGFGGMNTPLYMEIDPMLYTQSGTEKIEYLGSGRKGFNEQALDLVKKSLITQYSAYYNAVKGDVSKAFGEEVELERFLPIYPQLTYDVGKVQESVSPLNPRVHIGTLTRALMIVEYFAEGRFLSAEQRKALGKEKTKGREKVRQKDKSTLTAQDRFLLDAMENNRTIPILWEWTSEDRKLLTDLLPYLRSEGITINIPSADPSADSELYKMQKARIPNVIAKGKTTTYSSLSANTSLKQRIKGLQSRDGGADLLKELADFFNLLRTQDQFRKALIGEMSGRDFRKIDPQADRQTAFALISAYEEAIVKTTSKQDLINTPSERTYTYYYPSFQNGRYSLQTQSAEVSVGEFYPYQRGNLHQLRRVAEEAGINVNTDDPQALLNQLIAAKVGVQNGISRDDYDTYVTMEAIKDFLEGSFLGEEWKSMAVYWYLKCKSWNLSPKFLDILWRSSSYGIEWYVVPKTAVVEALQQLGGGKQLDTRTLKQLWSAASRKLEKLLSYAQTPEDIANKKAELREIQSGILKLEAKIRKSVEAGAKENLQRELASKKEERSEYRAILERDERDAAEITRLEGQIKGYESQLGEITLDQEAYSNYDAVTIVLNLKITQTERFNAQTFSKEEQEAQAANALGVRYGKVARSFVDTFLPRTDNNAIVDYMKAYLRWVNLQEETYTDRNGKPQVRLMGKNLFYIEATTKLESLKNETGILPSLENWIPNPTALASFVLEHPDYFEGVSWEGGRIETLGDPSETELGWQRQTTRTVGGKFVGLKGQIGTATSPADLRKRKRGVYTVEEQPLLLPETYAFFFDGPSIYRSMEQLQRIMSRTDIPQASQNKTLDEWYEFRDRGDNNPNVDVRVLAENYDIFEPTLTKEMVKKLDQNLKRRMCPPQKFVDQFRQGEQSAISILVGCDVTIFPPIADYKYVTSNLKEEGIVPSSDINIDNVSDVFSSLVTKVKKHPKAAKVVNTAFWGYVASFENELARENIRAIKRWKGFKDNAQKVFPPIDRLPAEEEVPYIQNYLDKTLPLAKLAQSQANIRTLANKYIDQAAPFIGKCLSYWGPLSQKPSFDQALLLHILYTPEMTAEAVFKLIYRQLDQKTAVCIFPPQDSLLPQYKAFAEKLADLVQVQENKKKFGVHMIKNCILSGDFKLAQRTADILDSLNMNLVFCCLTECDERNTNAVVFMHKGKLLTSYWKGSDKGLEKLTADWYKGKQQLPKDAAPSKFSRDEFSKLSPKEQQKVMFEEEKLRMKMRKGRKSKRTEDEEGILRWGEGWEALR